MTFPSVMQNSLVTVVKVAYVQVFWPAPQGTFTCIENDIRMQQGCDNMWSMASYSLQACPSRHAGTLRFQSTVQGSGLKSSSSRHSPERLCCAVTCDLCRPQSSLSSLITCGIESLALILTLLQSLDCFAVQIWGDRGGANDPDSSVALEGSSYCPGYKESRFSGKDSPKVADRSTGWE